MMCLSINPLRIQYSSSNSWCRKKIISLVSFKGFDTFIIGAIILNSLILMLKWREQEPNVEEVLSICNSSLAALFTFEAALKLVAFRSIYFEDNWNKFDFVIVILTLIGFTIEQVFPEINVGASASLVRAFRVLRILRLI